MMVLRIPVYTESPFKQIIDEQSRLRNEAKKKIRTALYASDVFQCQRKVFMQFFPEVFEQEAIDPRTARIFANGEDVHIRLGAYFHEDGRVQFQDEISVPMGEVDVHGRCDGLANLQGQVYILEFKSINKKFVTEAKEEHVGQLMYYLHMFEQKRAALRKEFGIDEGELVTDEHLPNLVGVTGRLFGNLDGVEKMLLLASGQIRGEIIYEAKPTQELFHFSVEYDPLKAEKVLQWFRQVQKCLDEMTLPHVTYDAGRFPCQWRSGKCPMFEYCHGQKHDVLVQFGQQRKLEESCAKDLNTGVGSGIADPHGKD